MPSHGPRLARARITVHAPPACALLLAAALALPTQAHAQGSVRGVVWDSLRVKGPLPNAIVQLEGVAGTALSDREGRFAFTDVPAGRHLVTFFHPLLDSLRASAPVIAVEVPASGLKNLRVAVPSFRTLSRVFCGGPQDSTTAIVIGSVREVETAAPIVGARAVVDWHEMSLAPGFGFQQQNRQSAAVSTEQGEFLLCGIPRDIALAMVVRTPESSTGPVELQLGDAPLVYRELGISLRDPASRALATLGTDLPDQVTRGLGRVRAVIRDERGRPLSDVTIGVRGAAPSARSDSAGVAVLTGVPSGTQTVVARSVGRAPTTVVATLVPEREQLLEITLDSARVRLADFVVEGIRPSPVREAFERRQRGGTGIFLDEAELAKRGRNIDALRGIGGMFLRSTPGSTLPTPVMRSQQGENCLPTIMLDGAPIPRMQPWEINSLMQQAKRVEIYTRALSIPLDLMAGRDCGLIGIWTY